uniref:Uncharacterized protein n=1 Tax=Panagrellus redivivus TaxID=6233 RepID=A0A7E4ZS75_PANRE
MKPKSNSRTTKTTSDKPVSPSLPVDKTQTATERSPTTQATPSFGHDTVANELAKNSAFQTIEYLPANEAPIPGKSTPRRQPRIVDEVVEYKRKTEAYIIHAQREKLLKGHNHMRLTDRIKFKVQHCPSDAERRKRLQLMPRG